MKGFNSMLLTLLVIVVYPGNLFSQEEPVNREFGITAGGFTNFPANQDYLTKNTSVFYLAPYIRVGKHEFSAGILYPLTTQSLLWEDYNIYPRMGATAGYKFYVFDVYGRENLFIHYSFQYLRFQRKYEMSYIWAFEPYQWTETDMYINNVIGLGYSLFFDTAERFGLFYTLDYVISQTSLKPVPPGFKKDSWNTQYVWNNLSTNLGFSFKIGSLGRKAKKSE
jgi:hypothetical protein